MDGEYYSRRLREETRASKAAEGRVARVHEQLAELYEARLRSTDRAESNVVPLTRPPTDDR